MTILFEQIEGGLTETPMPSATGVAALRLTGIALGVNLITSGAVGTGRLRIEQTDAFAPPPDPPVFGVGEGYLALGAGYSYGAGVEAPATAAGSLRLTGAFNGAQGFASAHVGAGKLHLRGIADNAGLGPPPPTDDDVLLFVSSLSIGATGTDLHTLLLRAKLELEATPRGRWEGTRTLRDTLVLEEQLDGIFNELLTVSLALGSTQAITYTAIAQMADALLLGGSVTTAREAYALITEAIAFRALTEAVPVATLTANVDLGATIATAYTAAARLVDELLLQVSVTPSVTLVALMRDDLVLGVSQASAREAFALLRDSLGFAVHLHADDDQFVAWSMNATSKAASRYTNYPFNSFFRIGQRYYGVADTGLKRLGGETDDGDAIAAKLRLGMSSLGTRVLKGIDTAYLGYTSSGDLFLKIIVANPTTGEREAHRYRLYARGASSQREGRLKIGKGMRSVYFDFQIESVAGAAFDLDVIEILPALLERRVRGNAGGKP